MNWWTPLAYLLAQVPLLIVILWLLNQLSKSNQHIKEYADRYSELAGHDVVSSRNYVRAMSERAADAESRADVLGKNRRSEIDSLMRSTVEEEEGSL